MSQAITQAATKANKAVIMAVREAETPINKAILIQTALRMGGPTLKQQMFDWKMAHKHHELCNFEIELKNIFLTNTDNVQESVCTRKCQ